MLQKVDGIAILQHKQFFFFSFFFFLKLYNLHHSLIYETSYTQTLYYLVFIYNIRKKECICIWTDSDWKLFWSFTHGTLFTKFNF